MPEGVEIDRSANSSIILVLVSLWRLSFSKTESGIRFEIGQGQAFIQLWEITRRASAKLSSKWRFRKISMNFKAKRHDNWFISLDYRTFSLVTLDGYAAVGKGSTLGLVVEPGVFGFDPGYSHSHDFGFGSNDSDCWLGCCVAWEEN
ncbi:hypothetical protein Tco_1365870, partial [Tanacetum coccineum]